jgi:aminobenzoyl-glutamate transport protein
MPKSTHAERKSLMFRFLDWVEWGGNKLPHPFWLFCFLILGVLLISDVLPRLGVAANTPETQILQTEQEGRRIDGRIFRVDPGFEAFVIEMEQASYSSRLKNIHVELYTGGTLVHERAIEREALRSFEISREIFPLLEDGGTYRIKFVSRSEQVRPRSLLSREGLNWFVLEMVENFAHFEPLGLVLVMLMGVAIAEGAGLIPTMMRGIAIGVPKVLITPALFVLAACGNVGSDAGIVVIPPLAAAIFRQLGRNPIVGLLVGYVGATAGFTANLLPAGTDVLAMSLTNAATGNNPEISVLANWYFMSASVVLVAILGTLVTNRYVAPRISGEVGAGSAEIQRLSAVEKRGIVWALVATAVALGIWLLTILPENALLRNPDPNLFWRSNFFKGLVPVLFSLFTVGGVVYGIKTGTIKRADDVIGFMADAMKRMGPFIVLVLVMSQFIRMFQFARLDRIIAIQGAEWLRAMGFESFPIPFFVAFIVLIALANLFMGSASAKWAIFAPIFVPMFLSLGYYPAFTQLLYRIGDSTTNCLSPLYPYFPLLLGWIAGIDKEKSKVGTVLAFLIPYANFLLIGWIGMLVVWYLLGLPVGPDSPILLNG